nr:MAG TPA: dsDNA helicase [Caudoviricetes sp.]
MKRYYPDVAYSLMRKGFKVIPISKGFKYPAGLDWANLPQTEAVWREMSVRYGSHAGAGIITDNNVMAIDIDVLDPTASRELIQYIRNMLSTKNILVRRGKRPKALIPCYIEHNIGKIVSDTWHSEKYGKMQIELLSNSADGARQFVAYGDYPDEKGMHYEWENDFSLLDISSPKDLPTFKPEMIQGLFRFFNDLMYRNNYDKVQTGNLRNAGLRGVRIDDEVDYDLLNDSKIVHISDERVVEILNTLEEGFYDTYDKWLRIGQAIKFQIEDSEKGFNIWKEWSAKAINPDTGKPYDISERELRTKWRSFRNDRMNVATFASVLYDYYTHGKNKNFTQTFEALKRMFEQCDSMEKYDELMIEAAYNRFNASQKNVIERIAAKTYERVYGEKISAGNVRKILNENIEHFETPDYMKNWVYVLNGDKFYDVEERLMVTPASFDTLIYSKVDDAMSMQARPQDLAIRAYKIPKVIDAVYMPTMGNLFKFSERSKYQYINAYNVDNVPAEPDVYTDEDRKAIELVEKHFEHLIECPKERELLRQWVAFQVQFTGHTLGWAVFLHGVGGDGKSFFHYLISAMIGAENAKIVSQDAMKSGFNKWATNLSFGTVEEVHLSGVRGVEIYDKLKTIIASPTIAMIAKGKDEINVPNTANYLFLSNRLAALPIDGSDRRIFALYSRWQDAKKIEDFKKKNPKYYPDLHNTYKNHAGALRKYFRNDVVISDEFLSYYDAPRTESRVRLISENLPESVSEMLEIVKTKSDPFISEDFLDVKYFRQLKRSDMSFKDEQIRWQQHLIPLGYELVAKSVRIPEVDRTYLHTVYSKNPTLFTHHGDSVVKALRDYVKKMKNEVLDYDDQNDVEDADWYDL